MPIYNSTYIICYFFFRVSKFPFSFRETYFFNIIVFLAIETKFSVMNDVIK